MLKRLITFIMLFGFLGSLLSADIMLERAEQFYKDKKYDKALITYNHLLESSPKSIPLLYNIANTHFKLNDVGYAIGYYRKALKWDPFNQEIRYNLDLARKSVVASVGAKQSLLQKALGFLEYISLNMSYYLLMGILLLLFGFLYLYNKETFSKEIIINCCAVSIILLLFSIIIFAFTFFRYSQDYVVVINKKVSVFSGPSDSMALLFYVHEGHECKVVERSGNWSEIQLKNGFKGWVSTETLFSI